MGPNSPVTSPAYIITEHKSNGNFFVTSAASDQEKVLSGSRTFTHMYNYTTWYSKIRCEISMVELVEKSKHEEKKYWKENK